MIVKSLYARIAVIYLLLLIAFGGFAIWITALNSQHFVAELQQRLQHDLAAHLARQLAPKLRQGTKGAAVEATARRLQAVNPSLNLYVLDARGNIIAYLMGDKPLARHRVPIAPIERFLTGSAPLPIQGDDPTSPGDRAIFSAAPIEYGPAENGRYQRGYLYVILRGMPYTSVAGMLQGSYIVRTGVVTLAAAFVLAAAVGLILFALLTRRFRRLTAAVTRFKAGDYGERFEDGADEIGRLGRAFNDMAATIQAQVEALQRTDATRRELVANVSHDLRTPLTSLRGYAERLRTQLGTADGAMRESLEAILNNTGHLERLIAQLSLLSRLDARQLAPVFEAFPLAELVQDVIIKFKPEAETLDIALTAEHAAGLPAVHADAGLVERALSNLIDNALHNTAAGGSVRVELQVRQDRVRISVVDTGHGIPETELALVTQRFYRTARSRASGGTGTGLGLSIANEIAELHGARLELASRTGKGIRATFDVPVSNPGIAASSGPPAKDC
ncbi:MAG TPA: HAMP domain-containing sensor histidine kinase [Rhodanobacteraceae bacterium]|nr:HAMP domain-containing sensor histidine kinase [Rhodanobacteraceae bacterium]